MERHGSTTCPGRERDGTRVDQEGWQIMEPRGIRCATRGGPIMSRSEPIVVAQRHVRLRPYCPACFDKARTGLGEALPAGESAVLHLVPIGPALSRLVPTPFLPASSSTSARSAPLRRRHAAACGPRGPACASSRGPGHPSRNAHRPRVSEPRSCSAQPRFPARSRARRIPAYGVANRRRTRRRVACDLFAM